MERDQDKTVISESPEKAKAEATQKIGHYEVVAELGRGGMGTVYRGYESSLNRYVAIKVLASHLADDESLVGRFSREAKSVAALNHPNVVHIYYTGEQDGLPYFVMECIEGETLADLVRDKGTLTSKEAAGILMQAAKGLASAHDRGIIHRDVKPSNLMIDPSGTVKITDFGIALARDIGDKLTTTGQFVGTTGYVSPEVFQGRTVDSRSDIFSLGVVLFEMLAGVKPFDDDSPMGLMLQVVEKPAPDIRELNPSVDQRLQAILKRMIEKSPDDRYQTCHELVEDLAHYLANEPLGQEASGEAATASRKSSVIVWPVLLLLCLGVGAAGFTWRQPLLSWVSGSQPAAPVDVGASEPNTPESTDIAATQGDAAAEPAIRSNSGEVASGDVKAADVETGNLATGDLEVGDTGVVDVDGGSVLGSNTSEAPLNKTLPAQAKPMDVAMQAERTKAAPVTAPVEAAVVVAARGDASLVGPLRLRVDDAMRAESLPVLDPAFVRGAQQELQAQQPDLSFLKDNLLDAGGRYLVLITATALDAESIEYYGQYDTLHTAQLEMVLYDLSQTRSLGRWSEQVSYTNLNAAEKTEQAFAGHVASLAGLITNE